MPEQLSRQFAQIYPGEESDFLNHLYKEEAPNFYVASFARFAIENKSNPYCRNLIMQAFDDFFTQQICSYNKYVVNVVGSVGCLAQDELREVAQGHGVKINKVVKAPLMALVEYHTK